MDGQVPDTDADAGQRTRSNNRRQAILDAAAYRFRRQGFAATTMRDIANDAGMLAGSLYYHFTSKTELLLAVHEDGVKRIADAVDEAVACAGPAAYPWERLEIALAAHLDSLLSGGDYAQVVIRDLPAEDSDLKTKLIGLRDAYEERFRILIEDLPVSDESDRAWLRLMLLGAANWSKTWFRTDGAQPEEIARRFVRLVRSDNIRGDDR